MYTSEPAMSSVFVSSVFLKVKKARLPQTSHRAVNLVTESAIGIMSSIEPKLLLPISKVEKIKSNCQVIACKSFKLSIENNEKNKSKWGATSSSHHPNQQLLQSSHHDRLLCCRNRISLRKIELRQCQSPLAVVREQENISTYTVMEGFWDFKLK